MLVNPFSPFHSINPIVPVNMGQKAGNPEHVTIMQKVEFFVRIMKGRHGARPSLSCKSQLEDYRRLLFFLFYF